VEKEEEEMNMMPVSNCTMNRREPAFVQYAHLKQSQLSYFLLPECATELAIRWRGHVFRKTERERTLIL
jgi:hypothetical protein